MARDSSWTWLCRRFAANALFKVGRKSGVVVFGCFGLKYVNVKHGKEMVRPG